MGIDPGTMIGLSLLANAGASIWGGASQAGTDKANLNAQMDRFNQLQNLVLGSRMGGPNPYANAMMQFIGYPGALEQQRMGNQQLPQEGLPPTQPGTGTTTNPGGGTTPPPWQPPPVRPTGTSGGTLIGGPQMNQLPTDMGRQLPGMGMGFGGGFGIGDPIGPQMGIGPDGQPFGMPTAPGGGPSPYSILQPPMPPPGGFPATTEGLAQMQAWQGQMREFQNQLANRQGQFSFTPPAAGPGSGGISYAGGSPTFNEGGGQGWNDVSPFRPMAVGPDGTPRELSLPGLSFGGARGGDIFGMTDQGRGQFPGLGLTPTFGTPPTGTGGTNPDGTPALPRMRDSGPITAPFLGTPSVDAFGALGRAGFNTGQDALLQMMRARPTPGMDPSLDFQLQRQASGQATFDNSGLFGALAPLDKQLIDQQVSALRGRATSLGQATGSAAFQDESNLRQNLSQQLLARNAQIQSTSFETAQQRALQALGLQSGNLQAGNQFNLGAYGQQLNAMNTYQQGALGAGSLGLQGLMANQQAQMGQGQFNAQMAMQAALANQGQNNWYNNFIMGTLGGANQAQMGQNTYNSQLLGLLAGVPVPTASASPWPGVASDITQMAMMWPFMQQMMQRPRAA
jgi:hypothetical protein